MAWEQIDITKPHLVYILLGAFTSLFMLCSSFIKERMYIGEATVATLFGVIFGPHAANLINPNSWGSADIVTIEFSRIVLVVQCFAIGVELPKFYMERHWKSVVYLLIPVMTFGWLVISLVIWWMIPGFDWLDGLVVAACITATDPVLASSVVGKGKFARRIPKHLRDLLSAESGCNDGMAFPFVYLSLYLIQYHRNAGEVSLHFVVYVILYECIFGAIFGFLVGYIARHAIKFAERKDLIDRESFLVFYFVVALFCAGSGSILGLDDLLVGFAAGVGFSNDGWFSEKTEESHVSNVIDLLLNLTYFVYLGTIIPWEQYNSGVEGLKVWRLVVIAIFVIFFRRIPIMLALKPFVPDIKSWREALFAGHFGPIGVGAIFVAILARAELEHGEPIPLAILPPSDAPEFQLIYLVWPIVTFIVISSILVHGSSIAVFTLGKRINTLSLTMSYTAAPEDGPTWMNRLPRISSQSRSQAKMSEASFDDDLKSPEMPAGTLAPPGGFLRRRKDDDGRSSRASSLVSRRRKRKDDDVGGPISQSAIFPNRDTPLMSPTSEAEKDEIETSQDTTDSNPTSDTLKEKEAEAVEEPTRGRRRKAEPVQVYEEGHEMLFENQEGDVLDVQPSPRASREELPLPATATHGENPAGSMWTLGGIRSRVSNMYSTEMNKRSKDKAKSSKKSEPARAYQFGNTIIVEDKDGEVVKTYELPTTRPEGQESDLFNHSLKYIGLGGLSRPQQKEPGQTPETSTEQGESSNAAATRTVSRPWVNRFTGDLGRKTAAQRQQEEQTAADDDAHIRFTIGGEGRRMTKTDFIEAIQKMDAGTREEIMKRSDASQDIKRVARAGSVSDPPSAVPKIVEHPVREERAEAGPSSTGSSGLETVDDDGNPSQHTGETAAERKRRLAVLSTQQDEDTETPAERRRREAALGMSDEQDESDDEPAPRRGIRFAAEPSRSKE